MNVDIFVEHDDCCVLDRLLFLGPNQFWVKAKTKGC